MAKNVKKYAVRHFNEMGSSVWVYGMKAEAKAKRDELNAAWWEEWGVIGGLWWFMFGCQNKWRVVTEYYPATGPTEPMPLPEARAVSK
jgi:hypothetical protein